MKKRSQHLDTSLLKYILYFYGVAFLLSSVSGLLAKWEGQSYSSLSWFELMASMVIRYGAKFLFVSFAVLWIRHLYQNRIISRWVSLVFHGVFGIGLAFYSIASQVVLNNWVFDTDDPLSFDYIYPRALIGTDYNFFLYFCTAALVYGYDYFKKQKDYELSEAYLKTQLQDAKMDLLQRQLQPHFLFNALNDIASLIKENPTTAEDCIVDLSAMLRHTLSLSDAKLITLDEELSLLKKYAGIEKVRFQEKIILTWNIDSSALSKKVPPLLFQPILENSMKHGFSYDHDRLQIDISIVLSDGYLVCHFINDGKRMETDEVVYGIGLTNCMSRLSTLFANSFEFDIRNREDSAGVETRLKFPV